MSTPPDMADRHARVLARLTELGLALAEQTFEDAQGAETPAARIESVKAFHTVSRTVRQCVALEARLVRQQAQDLREAGQTTAPPQKPGGVEVSKRIVAVRDAMTRVIWHEAEDDDTANWLEESFETALLKGCRSDHFCAEPLDDHIARLCLEMGLPEEAALNWRDLPEPPERATPSDEDDEADEDDDDEADEGADDAPRPPDAPPPPQVATPPPRPESSA